MYFDGICFGFLSGVGWKLLVLVDEKLSSMCNIVLKGDRSTPEYVDKEWCNGKFKNISPRSLSIKQ